LPRRASAGNATRSARLDHLLETSAPLDRANTVLPVSTYATHCEGVDMSEAENLGRELSAINESSETTIKLAELAAATEREKQDLMSEAIRRLYRIYIGDPSTGTPDEWTGPFSKKYSDRSAEVVVRQVGPATFKLREPFKYVDRGRRFDVPMEDISDFASVPSFLTWLIPRYGRHTLAALLHDHLQDHLSQTGRDLSEDPELVTSDQADTIFRQAMHYSRVPYIRRWVMWAAVSLRTVFKSGFPGKAAVGIWVLFFTLLGLAWPISLIYTITSEKSDWKIGLILTGAAILLPFILCWLWIRRWRLGLVSGLALAVVPFPCVSAVVVGGLYFLTEWIAERFQKDKAELIVTPPPKPPTAAPAQAVAQARQSAQERP
jgi:Protein of unknown function (DUF1353)